MEEFLCQKYLSVAGWSSRVKQAVFQMIAQSCYVCCDVIESCYAFFIIAKWIAFKKMGKWLSCNIMGLIFQYHCFIHKQQHSSTSGLQSAPWEHGNQQKKLLLQPKKCFTKCPKALLLSFLFEANTFFLSLCVNSEVLTAAVRRLKSALKPVPAEHIQTFVCTAHLPAPAVFRHPGTLFQPCLSSLPHIRGTHFFNVR